MTDNLPSAADLDAVAEEQRIREATGSRTRLIDLVGLITLPEGMDSVSYVRSIRDAIEWQKLP